MSWLPFWLVADFADNFACSMAMSSSVIGSVRQSFEVARPP